MNKILVLILVASLGLVAAGCTSNPTNEPSAQEIVDANSKRAAAIDADPSMTPEQKAKMKEMLNLNKSGGQKAGQ